MSNCSFCKDPVPAYDKPSKSHITVSKDKDGHIHTHGTLDDKPAAKELLVAAGESIGINLSTNGAAVPKEIIFRNRQRIGDILMFTCAVRDFKKAFPHTRVNVLSTAGHIWDHNPYVDRTLEQYFSPSLLARLEAHNLKVREKNKDLPKDKQEKIKKNVDFITLEDFKRGDTNVLNIGPSRGTNQSNRIDWHFANAFRISIEDQLGLIIPQGESRPDVWFSEEEYNAPRSFDHPYWVICVGGEKSWGCKMYPFERWQQVVDQNPDIKFVQIGALEDGHQKLLGANVIDWIGKTQDKLTGIRDLFKLFLHAEGSIGLVSFHMHLSGALYKPAVVVAGAREPVSFTRFPYHQYLATDGTLPCSVPACWHCGIDKCTNLVQTPNSIEKQVPKCVDMIPSEEVTQAIRRYYIGGRLKLDQACDRPKLKNVVKQSTSKPSAVEAPPAGELDWGKGAIDPLDWPFIQDVLIKHCVKRVLEFGAGLSTKLISELVDTIDSFETEQGWIDKVAPRAPKAKIVKWNGRELPGYGAALSLHEYDLAFVDGPANGQNREEAFRLAANNAKIVIVHDATRQYEAKWEEKYLKPGFQGPIKGGRWCHMWIKTASFKTIAAPPPPPSNPNKKLIRIVSTARGWGGCARSITTMMKLLLQAGHEVEFVPFRNKVTSREFIDVLKNGLSAVRVHENYDKIREGCDALMVYADDYVWEFAQPAVADMFTGLRAERKIMVLNYRRGPVGQTEWTKDWDKYLFLNQAQEKELLKFIPGADTRVLAPCTDLSDFFAMQPNYEETIRIVRHNSQGDTKFCKNFGNELANIHDCRQDLEVTMMPGPSWIQSGERFKKLTRNGIPIPQFLAQGNLFWYSLPQGYMDMGPRVILEAMAVGLPVLADNWGGAVDRVTPDTGWLCDTKEEMVTIVENLELSDLKRKGEAAKARAIAEFRPELWIEELTGEVPVCR